MTDQQACYFMRVTTGDDGLAMAQIYGVVAVSRVPAMQKLEAILSKEAAGTLCQENLEASRVYPGSPARATLEQIRRAKGMPGGIFFYGHGPAIRPSLITPTQEHTNADSQGAPEAGR